MLILEIFEQTLCIYVPNKGDLFLFHDSTDSESDMGL